MAWKLTADVEEFDEAVEAFRRRVPITKDLAAKVNGFTHQRGFTIAGVAQLDVVQEVHGSLLEAIRTGIPFEQWKKEIEAKLTAAWGRKDSPRIETIFRNATMQAYNAGRRRQMLEPDVVRFRPFWMFDGIDDSRQSEICKECDGTILSHDHPWWNTHSPQLHHRCRSGIRNLRESEAKRRGITQTPPATQADQGFGTPPESGEPWKPDLSKYNEKLVATFSAKQQELKAAPSATLEATPALRLKAAEFRQALELTDGGREARNLLREQIQESFPGAIPRNLNGAHILEASTAYQDAALKGANGYYEVVDSKTPGRIVVRKDIVEGAKKAADALASGKLGSLESDHSIDFLRTIIHEEMHGHSKVSAASYRDLGRVLEEVSNELCARKVLGDLVPSLTQSKLKDLGIGSYKAEVEDVVEAVAYATGLDYDAAAAKIVAAHHQAVLTSPGFWSSDKPVLPAFLDGLDVTKVQRQNIENALLAKY